MTEVQSENNKIHEETTDKFPCKNCGGNMVFEPESGFLSCKYCENKIVITKEQSTIKEYDFTGNEENQLEDWNIKTRVIKCEGCGAETVLAANETAQYCAFCGSSHVVKNDKSAGISPESLIPSKISEKNAKQLFTNWIKKRFFAPKALKSNYQVQRLKGIYIPCWTFDSQTSSIYKGEGGTYYYETQTKWVTENGKQVQKVENVRRIRWWPTSGTYSEYFNDVPVYASKQMDESLIGKLEPFNREELLNYKPEYMSGFFAERYSIGVEEGWQKALAVIDENINLGVRKQINADEVRNLNINSLYNDIKYKLTLLPIWISAYTYKSKTYTFMINGQTGKISGHSPLSALKIIPLAGLGVIIIGLGYFIFKK